MPQGPLPTVRSCYAPEAGPCSHAPRGMLGARGRPMRIAILLFVPTSVLQQTLAACSSGNFESIPLSVPAQSYRNDTLLGSCLLFTRIIDAFVTCGRCLREAPAESHHRHCAS